jgi:hypothetical protein
MDNFRDCVSLEDYSIVEAIVNVRCECGEELYFDYSEPHECEKCGRRYKISLDVFMEYIPT